MHVANPLLLCRPPYTSISQEVPTKASCLSAVRLVESELRAKVTMIMSTFSSCPITKTSSTTSLLEDQEWWMFFVPQDILVLYRSMPPTCGTHTLTHSRPTNAQDVCVIYTIVPVFYNVVVWPDDAITRMLYWYSPCLLTDKLHVLQYLLLGILNIFFTGWPK